MAGGTHSSTPLWSWALPFIAWLSLGAYFLAGFGKEGPLALILAAVLIGTVFSAVHHAEVVAHRVGEPFGTLVLAVAVTVIEVALIVTLLLESPAEKADLPRDTVFASMMIACNGIVGLCLVLGGARHHEQGFQARGASAFLAVLAAQATLVLVLPNFTTASPGPTFTEPQLLFVAAVSLVLYGVFLFVQTVRHRDYFLPDAGSGAAHAEPPSNRIALLAFLLLLAALGAVVLLAKSLTPALTAGVAAMGAPVALVGVAIAALVLLPEALAAVRAARRDRLQDSLNLALGSVLACIGLTIPAVAAVALVLHQPLTLGLAPSQMVLLLLTFLVSILTLGTGRTTVLQGAVHLVIFATYLFLVLVP